MSAIWKQRTALAQIYSMIYCLCDCLLACAIVYCL